MNLKELSSDDILRALGLQARHSAVDYMLPALGIFSVGVLVGAGIGMLLAPKTGAELRHQLGDRLRRRHAHGDGPAEVDVSPSEMM